MLPQIVVFVLATQSQNPQTGWSSTGIPGNYLCDAQVLAYKFAQKLLPERGKTGLAPVASGLNVNPADLNCTKPAPSPGPSPTPKPPVPHGTCSALMSGVNLVYGDNTPMSKVPKTQDAASCEAMCKSTHGCTYGTWHDQAQGKYKNRCILHKDNTYNPRRQSGHFSFLCNMSATLSPIPEPNDGEIQYLFDPQPFATGLPKRNTGWRANVPPLPTPGSGKELYVDSTKGSDSAAGSMNAPLKSIGAAVAKAGAEGQTTIYLRAGTFILSDTVTITAPGITIQPYQQEEVVVSGGVHLTPKWEKVPSIASTKNADPYDTYMASVPSGLSFLELFNGPSAPSPNSRLVPARYPDGNPEMDQNNFKFRGKEVSCKDFGPADTVIVNNTCAGCVDKRKGQFAYYSMGVGGPANNFDPPISYWAQPHPHGGGANTYDIPTGVSDQSNSAELVAGGGGYVFMKQTHNWGSWVYEISDVKIDAANHSQIMFGRGGFQEARGGSGGCGTGAFYVSHRREHLDSPGEWYLDEGKAELYTVVAEGGTPPASVVASQVAVLFRVSGSQASPAKNARISSLTLRHAAPTYMANYSVGSGGDYAVHRNGAITLSGTEGAMVDHNLLDGVGGNGVWLHAYNRQANVMANEMRNIGENGVGLTGETQWVDGTGGNQPRMNTIEGNLIHHLGLYTKQACAVFSAVSCQNTIAENVFFHGPRALFNMNDDFGGDTVIRSNLFFKAVLETGDHGPYNSWDRLSFLTKVLNGTATVDSAYNHLTANMFFSGSPFAIDTDDGSDRVNCTGNVVVGTPLFKTDFSGHTKTYQNNVALFGSCGGSAAHGDDTNVFTGNDCVGSCQPALNKDGSCQACAKFGTDCPEIHDNNYYCGSDTKTLCGAGHLESGSQNLPMPADGGIALAKAALGM